MSDLPTKFGALILSHGRPDRVLTWKSLRRCGYTGPMWIIIDDEDPTSEQYKEIYGIDNIRVFNKKEIAATFDTASTEPDMMGSVYARNASFQIAKDLGLEYFIQLDDDYSGFRYKYEENKVLGSKAIRSLDAIFAALLDFLKATGAASVAMSQGGDHIGGIKNRNFHRGLMRKVMNSFIYATNQPVTFVGKLNEDVNTYVTLGARGQLFFTAMQVQLTQAQTQSAEGGLSETYKDSGTYVKSFYTVMMQPSSVKVGTIGPRHRRYHHIVSWDETVPKIISSKYKKPSPNK